MRSSSRQSTPPRRGRARRTCPFPGVAPSAAQLHRARDLPDAAGAALREPFMSSDILTGSGAGSGGSGASERVAEPAAAADVRIVEALAHALVDGALPGELADFAESDRIAAARFMAACAARRPSGIALV